MLEPYFGVLVFLGMAMGMAFAFVAATYFAGARRPSPEKNSPYECGFAPMSRVALNFDVRFYLLAILFIVFDLEAAFLYPWAVAFRDIGFIGFIEMMLFLAVLLVGYVYAWKKGALEWE